MDEATTPAANDAQRVDAAVAIRRCVHSSPSFTQALGHDAVPNASHGRNRGHNHEMLRVSEIRQPPVLPIPVPASCSNLCSERCNSPRVVHDLRRERHHQIKHTFDEPQKNTPLPYCSPHYKIKQSRICPGTADLCGSSENEKCNSARLLNRGCNALRFGGKCGRLRILTLLLERLGRRWQRG